MRYSDKRQQEDFTIYVLFSDHLQGTASEIFEAASEDYPQLEWAFDNLGLDAIDTRNVTMAVDFSGKSETRGASRITGMPGRCEVNWDHVYQTSRVVYPNARDAVGYHTDHLAITVSSPKGDNSLAARFDAARRMTCLGAVLAKLPICVGVYFPSADLISTPKSWVEAADIAIKGEVPVMQWVAIYANLFQWDGDPPCPVTAGSVGMAAFNGHEIVMPQVRLDAGEAARWIYMTTRMLLESDHTFVDSDTLGVEGQGKPIRIRHLKEGQHEMQTDTWALFHEASLLDDVEMCGPRSRKPPPPGVDTSYMGDWNSLKNKLYSFVAGGRH